ncbi:hypothetical protein [Flavobacterium phycosphaerae]|uniref:hypothetical protein n=1 Tax=Flavobacterium phycosphaerae TaxID=2697515 RepID=UPI001389937C|nr:hypothetical protein [Flavobacterium phycosphaerae]
MYSALTGFVSLIFLNALDSHFQIIIYLYAIIGFVASEVLVKQSYYRHGLDDAFVLSWQVVFCAAVGMSSESSVMAFAVLFIVGLFSCIRYVNTLSALFSCVGLVGFFFMLITENKVISSMYLPFVGLILSAVIYYVYFRLNKNTQLLIYQNALWLIKVFSLVLAYAAFNYMVVRELSVSLMGFEVEKGNDIPLAYLFYASTFLIPLAYIYFSLLKKDRTILTVGLLALGYSFFTIRYYYSLMPPEMALVLGGLLLFGIAFLAIKKLKHKTTGITFEPDRDSNTNLMLNAQALIINSQINTKAVMHSESKMPFGGGGFSGGGASDGF